MWKERLTAVLHNKKTHLVISGLIGSGIGVAGSYVLVSKKFDKRLKDEIEATKNHYSTLYKKTEETDLETLASKYREDVKEGFEKMVEEETEHVESILTDHRYLPAGKVNYSKVTPQDISTLPPEEKSVEEAVEHNIFEEAQTVNNYESDDADTYFNFEEELRKRLEDPTTPYIITADEFNEGERDFEQVSLTYYEEDDILADSRDKPVDEIDDVVGRVNLMRFGHGSGDKIVVFVRNENLEADIEVTQSMGSYVEEVLGQRPHHIEHSDKPSVRKFRNYD